VDEGNYQSRGALAPCSYAGTDTCGNLAGFDLDECSRADLAGVTSDGIWAVLERYPRGGGFYAFFTSNLTLGTDGGLMAGGQASVTRRQTEGETFYLAADVQEADGGTAVVAYAGCRAPEAGKVQGCVVSCVNGRVFSAGTFEARKVQRQSESEAAGLGLVSEAAVALGTPVDVFVAKNHAYVVSVDRTVAGVTSKGGLTVFDVSNPAAPVKTAELGVLGDGTETSGSGVWAKGDALYVASRKGVRLYDISDPAHPSQRSMLPEGEELDVLSVRVHDDTLYATTLDTEEVLTWDVASPLSPVGRYRYTSPGSLSTQGTFPHDVDVFEDRLYVFHWGLGVQIAGLDQGATPLPVGAYVYPAATSQTGVVTRYGDRLIAFEGSKDWGAHLRVLDVTEPQQSVLIAQWRMRPEVSIHDMVLDAERKRLYVAHYQDGVRVLDVSDPVVPTEVAHFNTWEPLQPGRGVDFFDGAVGIRRASPPDAPEAGLIFVVDTTRGLLVLREQ
jgi:hypothetical protein